jgi:hypothetical protein
MPSNGEVGTPNPTEGLQTESTSQMAEKCLEFINAYRKGSRNPLAKATAIQKITSALTSATPELTEAEVNDALGSYLGIIEQQDESVTTASHHGSNGEPTGSRTTNEISVGSKRPGSPDDVSGATKRQKPDEAEFPWSIRECLSGPGLCNDLQRTLDLLKLFAKDLKFAKTSILTSASAPQFPNSEWSNVIIGAMVDLDHVISGSFAVSSDNRDVEVVGGIQFKFGAVKAIKQVRTSGDWFIAWGLYTQAAAFVFPHRKSELESYGAQVLSFFAATAPNNHSYIISLDKAIRVRVGEHRDLLLTDNAKFEDLRLYWLNPIGAGTLQTESKGKLKAKSDFRCEDPCDRWNRGVCRSKASECKYRHICQECRGPHRIDECKKSKKPVGGA